MPPESVRALRLVPSITTSAFVSAVSCRLSITTPVIRDGRFARAAALSCARTTPADAMAATMIAAAHEHPGATRRAQRAMFSAVFSAVFSAMCSARRAIVRARALLTTGRVLPAGEDLEAPLAAHARPLERIRIIDFRDDVAEDVEARAHTRAEHRRVAGRVRIERQDRVAATRPCHTPVEERRDLRRQIREVDEAILAHAEERDPHLG